MIPADWLSVFKRMYEERQPADMDRLHTDFADFLARNCGLLEPDDISLLIEIGALLFGMKPAT